MRETTLSDNALKVLKERYFWKDSDGNPTEDWAGLCKRVTDFLFPDNEELRNDADDLMYRRIFLPNTPTLVNAGRENGQLSACFVLPIEDSMDGIFTTVHDAAIIHKTGGGTGFSFSRLRPKNSLVHSTNGKASGVLSFLEVFNAATESVKQGGVRRGANMGILRVDHPEIMDWIVCKDDTSKLHNFNLSVGITDAFMAALNAEDDSFGLVDPSTGEIVETAHARDIWKQLVHQAWKNGEPGIIFLDTMNRANPTPEYGDFEATNPCVTGDTLVLTDRGYYPIQELVGNEVTIWNGFEWSTVYPKVTGENLPVLRVRFSNGRELTCTKYHKFHLIDQIVEAKDLRIGDKLEKCYFPCIDGKLILRNAYTQGFFSGDGFRCAGRNAKYISLYGEKKNLRKHFAIISRREDSPTRETYSVDVDYDKSFVPDSRFTIQSRLWWLAGLCDSDGSISSESIQITSVNFDFLNEVNYMLNTLGVSGTVSLNKKAQNKYMPDNRGGSREYECRTSYRLIIAASDILSLKRLGFETHRLNLENHCTRAARQFVRVESIEYSGIADKVYCFTEPLNHTGIFNGIMTGQCGEQPLLPYESCNLGSIDLSKCVSEVYGGYTFNATMLEHAVRTAVHILNAVIDHNSFPLEKIKGNTLRTRKIGLGVMGWADLLLKLDIPYDSEKAIEMAQNLMRTINTIAHEESNIYGYRNATCTTIAPTGTISMIADCSGGIEPNFSWVYTRNSMDTKLYVVHPILEELLKKRGLYREDIMDQLERGTPVKDIPELSDLGKVWKTSQEIDPKWHVYMQASFQMYTDNAVSKTINLAHDATEADVERIFKDAYALSCKGITVYRDGSRENQVLNHKTDEQKVEEMFVSYPMEKKSRPAKLFGETSKWNIGCGKLYVTANHDIDGNLEEVFTTTGKFGGCPSQSEATSRIISLALRYGVPAEDIIEQLKGIRCKNCVHKGGVDAMSCPDAIGRAMEEALRDIKDDISSIPKAMGEDTPEKKLDYDYGTARPIGKVLSVNAEDSGVRAIISMINDDVCPECGAPLVHAEGCVRCLKCTYSKCNG